jgi:cytochrome b pre-mRNA-processing protein 3
MILKRIFKPREKPERRLYEAIVAAARHGNFYQDMAVPDTIEGRFEMIVLHMYLVLRRLKDEGVEDLRQGLTDEFFADMDGSLREFGVSDVAVGKKVRKLAESYYGRLTAYDKALNSGGGALEEALRRNILPDDAPVAATKAMADYVVFAVKALSELPREQVMGGRFSFR